MPLTFGRRFVVEQRGGLIGRYALADWDAELPYLSGVYTAAAGWIVTPAAGDPQARCSAPMTAEQARPPAVLKGNEPLEPEDYWQGIHLYVPGHGGQEVLFRSNPAIPTGPSDVASSGYRWLTNRDWFLRCIPLQQGAGEGFVARSPDGLVYRFDVMVTLDHPSLAIRVGANKFELVRKQVRLYASQVSDRFGNTIDYHWTGGRLTRIQANDGRSLDFFYVHPRDKLTRMVASVPGKPLLQREWLYQYQGAGEVYRLESVTQPDGSQWQMDFGAIVRTGEFTYVDLSALFPWDEDLDCTRMRRLDPSQPPRELRTARMQHPSGAVGEFVFRAVRHGRSNVPVFCRPLNGKNQLPENYWPARFDVHALEAKRLSGPGLPATITSPNQFAGGLLWQYDFAELPLGGYQGTNCAGASPPPPYICADTRVLREQAPDGSVRRYTFGIRFGVDEGQALGVAIYANASAPQPIRTELYSYAAPGPGAPFPDRVGSSPQPRGESFASESLRPQRERRIDQDQATFIRNVLSFDVRARPLTSQSFSSLGFSRQDASAYADFPSQWLLGQEQSAQVNGQEVRRAEFFGNGQIQHLYAHGRRTRTFTFHGDGALASAADGRSLTTSYTDWYRGVPRSIVYHDATSQSAEVNGHGWITQVTNQRGHSTGYAHDLMGRLTQITPPANGANPWALTTVHFAANPAPAFGLPAGHWRHRLERGNYRRDTFYDAMWRPVLVHEQATDGSLNRYRVHGYDGLSREVFSAYPLATLTQISQATSGVQRSFDALGRLRQSTASTELGPQSTLISYLSGLRTQRTLPGGAVTTIHHQAFDEPTEAYPVRIEAPEGQTTEILRDVYGKPLRIARSDVINNQTTTLERRYVYDAEQRLCKRIEPETGVQINTFDSADNLHWSAHGLALTSTTSCDREAVPSSERIERHYDARNRLQWIDYPDASADIHYTHYADGRIHTASRMGGTWTYQYNSLGLVQSESLHHAGQMREFNHHYNANGVLQRSTYPDQEPVHYAPNALGQTTQVGSYASQIAYHPGGSLAQAQLGNGMAHSRPLNLRQLPLALTYSLLGQPLQALHYSYDANGNLSTIQDLRPGGSDSQSFGYDDLDRLTSASAAQSYGIAEYHYDAFDNIRYQRLDTRELVYDYDSQGARLDGISLPNGNPIIAFGYNTRGHTTSGGPIQLTFDRADTMTAISGGTLTPESYQYDAAGHRIRIDSGAQTRFPVYTQDGLLRGEYSATSYTQYYYLGTQLIARKTTTAGGGDGLFADGFEGGGRVGLGAGGWVGVVGASNQTEAVGRSVGSGGVASGQRVASGALASGQGSAPFQSTTSTTNVIWYLSDHLGSNIATANSTGQIIERSQFAPYGERWTKIPEVGPAYAGHYEDPTGLTYMKARYYSPLSGRFISPDPVGLDTATGGNFNRYWYANNSPHRYTDPDGRSAQDQWFGHNDSAFKDWVHQEKQDIGRRHDFTKQELDQLKEQWEKEGKPRGKGGKSSRGGAGRGMTGSASVGFLARLNVIFFATEVILYSPGLNEGEDDRIAERNRSSEKAPEDPRGIVDVGEVVPMEPAGKAPDYPAPMPPPPDDEARIK